LFGTKNPQGAICEVAASIIENTQRCKERVARNRMPVGRPNRTQIRKTPDFLCDPRKKEVQWVE
jgi:hypothetical protein